MPVGREHQEPPNQLRQLAVSVLDHLRKPSLLYSGGVRYRTKVAVGNASPTKNSKSSKSSKSFKSIRSNHTGGRSGDDDGDLWEYATPLPDVLNASPGKLPSEQYTLHDTTNGNSANSLDNHSNSYNNNNGNEHQGLEVTALRHEIKRKGSLTKGQLNLDDLDERSDTNNKKIVDSRDLYDEYNMGGGSGDDMDDMDDDDDDDAHQFAKALTSEAQDEVAYFSQRVGNAEFKLSRRLVIHPHGRTRALWDSILMFLISWILVVVPFELSFLELNSRIRRDLLRFDLFVDSMFVVDIILNFNTGIERDGKLHFSFRSIYRHYLRGWFFFDVIWTVPFYAFYQKNLYTTAPLGTVVEHSNLYNLFRILRLLRVAELPHVQRRLEYSLLISSKISSLGSFLYVVLALSHVFSCMFAYLAFGDQEHLAVAVENGLLENADLQSKYIASFYWSMMTMTTVGYGDITVRTNTGRLFALAAMVVGGGISAYGITNVVALFQQLYIDETQHRHKMDQVNTFMHNRALPRKLRDEIRANFFHMRKATRESKLHDYKIFKQMSRTLQTNVAALFCQEMMPHKMPFLAGCNAEFIHELYLSMEVRCYLPGEDIIRQDDYGSEMYFLFVGHVQVFLSHTKVAALGPNAFFGEFGIFNPKKPRLATIQALDFCEAHCIQRRDVFRILVEHPFMLRSIKNLAALRSRKALNILYESGGKSRTSLQGLASMWHQEGIMGLLPRGLTREELPSLQEYLPAIPVNASAASMRRASVRAALMSTQSLEAINAAAAAGAGTGRRRSIVFSNQDLALIAKTSSGLRGGIVNSQSQEVASSAKPYPLRGLANSGRDGDPSSPTTRPKRRTSIDITDKARIVATLATMERRISVGEGGSQSLVPGLSPRPLAQGDEHRELPTITSTGPASSTSSSSVLNDHRLDILIRQLQGIAKHQELLDDQMQEILMVLAADPHGLNRFHEQYQHQHNTPPLGRDRSQYFHRSSTLSIPEGNVSRFGR